MSVRIWEGKEKYMKKIVQRMCMGCNNKKDKKDLIRIVLSKNGEITIDKTGKLEGRGAYICDNIDCLESYKNKKIRKKFRHKNRRTNL